VRVPDDALLCAVGVGRWDEGVLGRLAGWRAGALMIPDGISSCRVAVPSPRDLLPSIPYHLAWERRQQDRGTTQDDRGTTQDDWGTTPDGQPAQASAHAYGVLQSHPVVNRVCPRLKPGIRPRLHYRLLTLCPAAY